MKKSRTFDEVLRLNADAGRDVPAIVRSHDQLIELWWDTYAETLFHNLGVEFGKSGAQYAEDIVSETFLRLYKELVAGTQIKDPAAWAWTVARRSMLTQIKRNGVAEAKYRTLASQLAQGSPTPHDILCNRCKHAAFERALATLSSLERRCLVLRANNLTLTEIGRTVSLDHRRVAEVIARAVQRLAEKVDE
jgi:RNA polymerase sigma factor (sigma-70 family)